MHVYEQPDGAEHPSRPLRPASQGTPENPTVRAVTGRQPVAVSAAQLLALQRTAGNAGVVRLLHQQRQPAPVVQLAVQRAATYTDEAATISHYLPNPHAYPSAYQARDLPIRRPQKVSGTISPTVTKGRGGAPNPWAVVKLFEAYKAARTAATAPPGTKYPHLSEDDVWRDLLGGAGHDRGHIMGLEVGGDDISENIVPQWSLNQQSGNWREQEKAAVANKTGNIEYTVNYKANSGSWRKVMIPTGIDVSLNTTAFHAWDNAPDANDIARAGTDPGRRLKDLFWFIESRYPKGSICTPDDLDEVVFDALADELADIQDQEQYVAAGGSANAGPPQHATFLATITKSDIEKKKRKRQIDEMLKARYIRKVGKDYEIL
ncbi:hypothetical protein GCM10027290_07070 [Micromonospora sonneratiae]|uniref:DNA/RNA non-specific endonuclease n=1 Tax=Micromonospora sonneratiae TaxID=1184706 RepID=A0ABW3Y943_9ACTN